MEAIRTRHWYRLHWITWVAVVIQIAALTYCQFVKQFGALSRTGYGPSGTQVEELYFGWPTIYEKQTISGVIPIQATAYKPTIRYNWHFPSLAFNLLVSLSLVFAVEWALEVWLRKPKRWQFSIREAAFWIAVIGVVITIVKQRFSLQQGIAALGLAPGRPFEQDRYAPGIDAWGWATIVVVLFGIGCFIRWLIHLASRTAKFIASRLD